MWRRWIPRREVRFKYSTYGGVRPKFELNSTMKRRSLQMSQIRFLITTVSENLPQKRATQLLESSIVTTPASHPLPSLNDFFGAVDTLEYSLQDMNFDQVTAYIKQ